MAKQSAIDSLKESIRMLEIRQAEEGKILKEQFKITYESLKPVNLIKSSMKELVNSTEIKNSLFEAIVSVVSGYLTKKFIVRSKSNIFMKLLGVLLQFGVTNVVSKNSETIRTFIFDLIQRFFTAEEETTES